MTPAERRAALVEKVADAIDDAAHASGDVIDERDLATAALTVALEEAAKACDVIEDQLSAQWRAGLKGCTYTEGASDGAGDCAAAIRELIPRCDA